MAQTKIQKQFVYDGFCFPVKLENVRMVKVRGQWTPKIDLNELAQVVLRNLAEKASPLTGDQIRFVRQFFEMTLEAFGKRFDVSHPAVLKWEKAGEEPSSMAWATEKDLRLFILHRLNAKPKEFKLAYESLRTRPAAKPRPLKIQWSAA